MTLRLTASKVAKMKKLLPMEYKVAEIAACMGVTAETIYHAYLPAGAPFTRAANGEIWIVGTDFEAWARSYLAGKKLKKKTMGDHEAFCGACQKVTGMVRPRVAEVQRTGVARLQARCKVCGKRVSRFQRMAA